MNIVEAEATAEMAWDERDSLDYSTQGPVRTAVETTLAALDDGTIRVASPAADGWIVHQWIKKAVLLSFILNDMELIPGGPGGVNWWDKVPSKFVCWGHLSGGVGIGGVDAQTRSKTSVNDLLRD